MKAYCAMHDLCLNYSDKRWNSDIEGKTECKCCDRPHDNSYNHGLELEFDLQGNITQNVCNCFITGDGKGYYSKEELEKYNGNRTIQEMEETERDFKLEFHYEERKIEGSNEYGYYRKEEFVA